MLNFKIWFGLLAMALVTGCASTSPDILPPPIVAPPPAPPSPPVPPSISYNSVDQLPAAIDQLPVTRSYLFPGLSYRPADDIPNGVVLLARGDDEKNRALCEGFITLPDDVEFGKSNPDSPAVQTYWLLNAYVSDAKDCGQILASYDFDRAASIYQDIVRKPLTSSSMFLIMPDLSYVGVSFARFTPAQTTTFMTDWFSRVIDDKAPINAPRPASTEEPDYPRPEYFEDTDQDSVEGADPQISPGIEDNLAKVIVEKYGVWSSLNRWGKIKCNFYWGVRTASTIVVGEGGDLIVGGANALLKCPIPPWHSMFNRVMQFYDQFVAPQIGIRNRYDIRYPSMLQIAAG